MNSSWNEMLQTKVVEKIKTRILRSINVYEIMWKNMVDPERPQVTI